MMNPIGRTGNTDNNGRELAKGTKRRHCAEKDGKNKERIDDLGQDTFLEAQKTNGFGEKEKEAVKNMKKLSRDGFEKLMKEQDLDALVTPYSAAAGVLAIGQYPGISVPAGFIKGVPFGICFGGLRGSEPKLIEIAYAFEQATKIRKPPALSFSSS